VNQPPPQLGERDLQIKRLREMQNKLEERIGVLIGNSDRSFRSELFRRVIELAHGQKLAAFSGSRNVCSGVGPSVTDARLVYHCFQEFMDENLAVNSAGRAHSLNHERKFSHMHCKRRGLDGRLTPAEPRNTLSIVETEWRDEKGRIRFHYNVLVTDKIKDKYRLTTLPDQVQEVMDDTLLHGETNLFQAIVLFLFYVREECGGMLMGMSANLLNHEVWRTSGRRSSFNQDLALLQVLDTRMCSKCGEDAANPNHKCRDKRARFQ
jgi:hypothetical protein